MAKNILIVEDEVHVSNYLRDIFQDAGYETRVAASVEEGLELAQTQRPDLITLDLQMPGEHGTRFFQKYRKDPNLKSVPIIVISGQSAPQRSINEDKVVAIVEKPFDPAELVRLAQGAIGQA